MFSRKEEEILNGENITYYKNGNIKEITYYINAIKNGNFKSYFENGLLEIKGRYKNGLLNGLYKRYYENGKIYFIFNYKNGELEGEHISYYKNGNIKEMFFYKEGLKDGECRSYLESGELERFGFYKAGERSGKYTWYYKNENIKEIGQLKEGKRHGKYIQYYETGEMKIQGLMKNDAEIKFAKYYKSNYLKEKLNHEKYPRENYLESENIKDYDSYELDSTSFEYKNDGYDLSNPREKNIYSYEKARYLKYYEAGNIKDFKRYKHEERDGKYTEYYKSGKKREEAIYIQGRIIKRSYYYKSGNLEMTSISETSILKGYYKAYYENGNLKQYHTFKNKNLEGKFLKYYENGEKKEELRYENGLKNGEFLSYYENKNIKEKKYYVNNFVEGVYKKYNSNRVLIKEGFIKKIKGEYSENTKILKEIQDLIEFGDVKEITELIISFNGEIKNEKILNTNICKKIVEKISVNAIKFSNLEKIYFGDTENKNYEIPWINICDMTKLIMAFPNLKSFKINGAIALRFENLSHNNLKELILINSRLGKNTIKDIEKANLDNLEHLELYLGGEENPFDVEIEDLEAITTKKTFQKLKYLGLKNTDLGDEIAELMANSKLLEQLETLDLSMVSMTDLGADFLLKSKGIKTLKVLNIDENFIGEEKEKELKKMGIKIISFFQRDKEEEEYYESIGEYEFINTKYRILGE